MSEIVMKLQIRVNLNATNGLVLCSMGPHSAVVNDVILRFDPFYILLMSTDTVVNQQVIPFEIQIERHTIMETSRPLFLILIIAIGSSERITP